MRQAATSAHFPDLAELRAWLEKMLAAMKFVELVVAVVALIGRMRDINLELTKRLGKVPRPPARGLRRRAYRVERPLFESFARSFVTSTIARAMSVATIRPREPQPR